RSPDCPHGSDPAGAGPLFAILLCPTTNLPSPGSCAKAHQQIRCRTQQFVQPVAQMPCLFIPQPAAAPYGSSGQSQKGPRTMRKSMSLLAATSLLALGALTACSSGQTPSTNTKTPKIGVILPDSASSARWETADRKYLEAAFKAAGVQ